MEAKKKLKWYQNEGGAIDLASIMVGIIVIGLIGGVIAATVFAVIPWSQDNAAKQQLGSIVQAENAYIGLSSTVPSSLPAGLATNSFANSADLETAGLLKTGTTYCASTANTGSKSYEGYARSSSGALFRVSDKNTSAASYTGPLPADCSFLSAGGPAPVFAYSDGYVDPTPTITKLTYKCDFSTFTGVSPMKNNINGTETWDNGTTKTTANYTNGSSGVSHTLSVGVTYTLTFDGTYSAFSLGNIASCLKSVDYWGAGTGITDASSAFENAGYLTHVPDRLPPTITNMNKMLYMTQRLNDPNISKWDVSNVTSMSYLFGGGSMSFNQPLSTWNTSNVTDMSGMFHGAIFNQSLSSWDTSKVTNMSDMFGSNVIFNQPLSTFKTSKVTNMSKMFNNSAKFNQPIGNWDTSQVTDMNLMFANANLFNSPLSDWNTSNVTDMTAMFNGATVFNQYIKGWTVSKVTSSATFRNNSALTAANSPF